MFPLLLAALPAVAQIAQSMGGKKDEAKEAKPDPLKEQVKSGNDLAKQMMAGFSVDAQPANEIDSARANTKNG